MTSPPNATERNQHTLKLNSAQGGAGEVLSEVAGWAGASWCSLAVDGGASSLFSGIAAVAPACALAGVFAKASAQASSGPAMRGITGFVWFDDSKDAPGGPVPPSNPKKTLRLRKSEPRNRGKDPFIRSLTPPGLSSMGVGRKALKALPSLATRGRARDRSASNSVPSRFNVRSARNSFRRPQIHPRASRKTYICHDLPRIKTF
jgi:hypothetical protein